MNARDAALQEIAAIAARHGLSADEVRDALAAKAAAAGALPAAARQGPLARALAYLGGTFVLAGLAVFVGTFWDDMNSAERIVVTLGSGVVALVLAYFAHGSAKRDRLATPLFLIAAILQPTGILVALGEMSLGGDFLYAQLAVSLVMLVQCAIVYVRVRRAAVLFCTIAYAGVALASGLEALDIAGDINGLVTGASVFLLTCFVRRGPHASITPFWYFVSSAFVMGSWYEIADHHDVGITTVAIAAGFVYLSTLFRSRTLLAAGTIGVLATVGEFTGKHFADSIGWPLALILLGILMMGLGALAVRIHRRYIRTSP